MYMHLNEQLRSETVVTVEGLRFYANFFHFRGQGCLEAPEEVEEYWLEEVDDSPLSEEEVKANLPSYSEKILDKLRKTPESERWDWEKCRA